MRAMTRATERELGEPSAHECPQCGSVVHRALVPFRLRGRLLGYFPADVCAKGHEYFTEESGAAIQAAANPRRTPGAAAAGARPRPRRGR